jgi:hypothetical protein
MIEIKVGLPRASGNLVNGKEVCKSILKIVIIYDKIILQKLLFYFKGSD